MPSKIQLHENLWFLYICLQNSDLKVIDFNAVGTSMNLKAPAARMRYTRLRRQIESGSLTGTNGIPFTGGAGNIKGRLGKRKRMPTLEQAEDFVDEPCDAKSLLTTKSPNGENPGLRKRSVVKPENFENEYESESSSSDADSEDEMPLAKLRKAQLDGRNFRRHGSQPPKIISIIPIRAKQECFVSRPISPFSRDLPIVRYQTQLLPTPSYSSQLFHAGFGSDLG